MYREGAIGKVLLLCLLLFFILFLFFILKIWNASRICVSSLRRGHANLLCIVPILVYVLPKRALYSVFLQAGVNVQFYLKIKLRSFSINFNISLPLSVVFFMLEIHTLPFLSGTLAHPVILHDTAQECLFC